MAVVRLAEGTLGRLRTISRRVGGWPLWSLSEPLRSYLIFVTCLAVSVTALTVFSMPWKLTQLLIFVGLLLCGVIAIESTRGVREVHGTVGRDLQSVWYLAAAITLPVGYAMLAPVPMAAYRLWRVRSGLMHRRVFSNATISLAYGAVSILFKMVPSSVAGLHPGSQAHVLTWTVVVTACATIAVWINCCFLFVAIKLSDKTVRLRDLFGTRESVTADLLEISLAVSLTLVVAVNPALMALALPSVILCRRYLMRSQLVAQVRVDPGTGLLNSGTWQREAEVELFRAVQASTPLAVAMVDIDDFRSMRESVGDDVARQLRRDVASMLAEQLRDQDLIGIFEVREFAILFPCTSVADAKRMSERLRDRIAGESIAIESGTQAGFVFRLTVSIGVAVMNESRRALAELIDAADVALVTAKKTGMGRVCIEAQPLGAGD
jgi:diguanylate cyclase (GGDEF)-like protein